MKKHWLLLLVFFPCILFCQESQSISFDTFDNGYVFCKSVDLEGNTKWVKTVLSPSKAQVLQIQKQLNYLGYNLSETSILDDETKKQLEQFNFDAGLGKYPYILFKTEKKLKRKCLKKQRSN